MKNTLSYISRENQFYPTPAKLIREILDDRTLNGWISELTEINFLEPCAGDGAICREVKAFFTEKEKNINISCVEIEKVLRDSLIGQGFNVVGEDFEEIDEIPFYDLIFMNPPFSKGAEFLLKAYGILNANGKLICILNAETIKNPCNKSRELLKNLIERAGEVQFLEKAFEDADRTTGVEIAVVYLTKPFYENEFDVFGGIKNSILTEEEKILLELKEKITSTEIMPFDKLDHSIGLYRNCVKQIFTGIDTIHNIKGGLSYLGKESEEFNIDIKQFISVILENDQDEAKEKTIKMIRKMVWSYILKFCNMDRFLFSKHQQDFYNKLDKGSSSLPFTRDNILQFFNNIFQQRNEYLKKGIIDLFEEITSYHNGNTYHREGWKTNKNWKINKKIIVKWGVQFDTYSADKSGKFSVHYGRQDWLDDLDKIVRRIKPINPDLGTVRSCLREKFRTMNYIRLNENFSNELETSYFHLKFFKKGTLHIIFKDDELLKELNKSGAKLRTDLGYDDFGKNDSEMV